MTSMRVQIMGVCILGAILGLSGCSPSWWSNTVEPEQPASPIAGPTVPGSSASPSSAPTTELTAATDPTRTSEVFVAITGPEEVIFDWSTDRCDPQDFPDMPTRAFRNAQGLIISNRSRETNRLSVGPDLDHMDHRCEIALDSSHDRDPSHYNSHEWFQAFYTDDGQTVYAILHNEQCDGPGQNCLYQNMTHAISTDGGYTYQQLPPPDHLVAVIPYPYDPEFVFYGMVGGSNILHAKDGFYYMAALNIAPGGTDRWVCMLRTMTPEDSGSWRAWDGADFNMEFQSPYVNPEMDPAEHQCQPVASEYGQLASMHESLTYNSYLDRYVLLGVMDQYFDGQQVWGIYYSLSPDLLHWSERRLVREVPTAIQTGPGGHDGVGYPVLLDPDSPSPLFDEIDQDAYLYYTRFNYHGDALPDGDLVRYPVSFQVDEERARELDVRTKLSVRTVRSENSLDLTGELRKWNGQPMGGETIQMMAEPLDSGRIVEYRLRETVPQGFTEAVAGLRMNTECLCEGSGELTVFEFSYREAGGGERVPNGSFQSGLDGYYNLSTGLVEFLPDAMGEGAGVHIAVTAETSAAIHSPAFAVTPGQEYEFVVRAKVEPGSERSGHFALIFSAVSELGARMMIPLEPYQYSLGTATTDQDGVFHLSIDLPTGSIGIEAQYDGSETYWPSTATTRYP